MTLRPNVLLRAALVVGIALPAVAAAQIHREAGDGGVGRRFVLPEHDLYPESIAWDSVSGDFFLGSMAHRRILRVSTDGTYRDFLPREQPSMEGAIGLKADAARRRLWVCTGRYVLFGGETPGPPKTGVLLFDLDTGALRGSWLLPQPSSGQIFNDLAVAEDGAVYVTTTLMGRVYRVDAETPEPTVVFESEGLQTNGITLDAAGRHLFFSLDRGIARLDLSSGDVLTLEGGALEEAGTDGLYFVSGGLVSVQPRRRRVVRLQLDEALRAVTLVDTLLVDHPDFAYPTTGVLVGDTLVLVASSFADRPRDPDRSNQHGDVIILNVDLTRGGGGPGR